MCKKRVGQLFLDGVTTQRLANEEATSCWSGKIPGPTKTEILKTIHDCVRKVNSERYILIDREGMEHFVTATRKAMIQAGLSLGINGYWEVAQLKKELRHIVESYPQHFNQGFSSNEVASALSSSVYPNPDQLESPPNEEVAIGKRVDMRYRRFQVALVNFMTRERLIQCAIELVMDGINENRRDPFKLEEVEAYMCELGEEKDKAYLLNGVIRLR
jgi:hypothetical protein